jgi:putative addiction module CopG family antidote
MNLSLPVKTKKLIESKVRSGRYHSAEDVVTAAISQLEQQEQFADFGPGELDRLLAQGEKSGKSLDGEKVLSELRSQRRKRKAG